MNNCLEECSEYYIVGFKILTITHLHKHTTNRTPAFLVADSATLIMAGHLAKCGSGQTLSQEETSPAGSTSGLPGFAALVLTRQDPKQLSRPCHRNQAGPRLEDALKKPWRRELHGNSGWKTGRRAVMAFSKSPACGAMAAEKH